MPVTHEPWLVALSPFLAILTLAVQVGEAIRLRRRVLIAAAAIPLAFAVWAMHFIGFLAARLPFPVDDLVVPTLLSFLICVVVVGAAVFAANAGPLRRARCAAAAVFMGLGIVWMHYPDMTALHASAHMTPSAAFVAGSVAVAIAASGLALWVAVTRRGRPPLLFSATALSATHYVAVEDIVAIHANAHYGASFDANLDRIVGFHRTGDSGPIELPDRSTVPVSRSRLGWLKLRLNQKIDLTLSLTGDPPDRTESMTQLAQSSGRSCSAPPSSCSGDCHHGFPGRRLPFSSRTKHRQCPPSRAAERPSQRRSP